MKTKMILRIYYALACLVIAVGIPLSAQQLAPPTGQRVPPTSPAPKQATASPAQSLERRCREFLAPAEELHARFAAGAVFSSTSIDSSVIDERVRLDDELASALKRARECVVNLPNTRLRLAALDAYELLLDEQATRVSHFIDAIHDEQMDDQKGKQQALKDELNKQRADFSEVANFATKLEKQKQEYLVGFVHLARDYVELQDRYRAAYNLADEAIHLAQEVTRTRLSLPVFVNTPAPQVIRVETPAVPRSLHCTANTMPPPAAGLPTWTWTDCHW